MKRTPAPLRPSTPPGAAPKYRVARTREQPGERLAIHRVLLLVSAIAALTGMSASAAPAHNVDLDCSDFGSQAQAQEHRDRHAGDPDRLDDDEDGTACEELPCPCGFIAVAPAPPEPARPTPGPLPWPQTTKARVASVVDASTLKVRRSDGEMIEVRLIGVDSPARRAGSRGECGARGATARMKRLAFGDGVGRIVELRTDPMHDRAGQTDPLLAYVGVGGVDFGRTMISAGWAKVHSSEANFLRVSAYRKAQASAKAAKRGLWRSCGNFAHAR